MNTRAQQVTKIPPPIPGELVTIPLELWPLYQQANRIEAMTRTEVQEWEKRTGEYKPDGVVMVRRSADAMTPAKEAVMTTPPLTAEEER